MIPLSDIAKPSTVERYSIDDIHARLDLGDFIASRWGVLAAPRWSGADRNVECPIHRPGHHRGDAKVHRWSDGRQTFKCWEGCTAKAVDVFALVELVDGMPFGEAVQQVGVYVGASTETVALADLPGRDRSVSRLAPLIGKAETVENVAGFDWRPGEVEDTEGRIAAFARSRRWKPETLAALGVVLVERNGQRCARFPFTVPGKGVVNYEDRKLDPSATGPKWLSAKGQKKTFYNPDGFARARNDKGWVVVVEGVPDAVALMDTYGLEYPVVGVPGAGQLGQPGQPLQGVAVRLRRAVDAYGLSVLVVGDNDPAGRKFAQRAVEVVQPVAVEVERLDLPDLWNDVADMLAGTDSNGHLLATAS